MGCIFSNNISDEHYKYPIDDITINGNNIKWTKRGKLLGWGMSSNVFICESHNNNKACMKIFKRSNKQPNLFYLQSIGNKIVKKDKIDIPRRESENLKKCNHPNIVKWLDYIENKNYIYIIMEYISGQILLNYISDNNYLPIAVTIIVISIIKAIENLDENELMHLDLKPENIIINPNNLRVTLLDFGTCSNKTDTITEYRGTLGYTCPEIVIKCNYSNNPDIWSIGCILYLLVEQKLPYSNDEYCMDEFEDIIYTSKWDKYSLGLKDFCKYMLVFDNRPSVKECVNHDWIKQNIDFYTNNIDNIGLRFF
mgnify:CR=1 FL=1